MKIAVLWAIKTIISTLLMILILFIPAGRWDWGWAWVLVAIQVLNQAAVYLLVTRAHPDLLLERGKMQAGTKPWDRVLAPLMAYSPILLYLVCGLDARFGWTVGFPEWLRWLALALVLLGVALGLWAIAINRFFSATVRIQTDRGHRVVDGGPYRWMRHPGYLATVIYAIALPMMLGSWWGLIPGGIALLVTYLRTRLEDETLQAELPGYVEYASRVRFRWLPGIW